MPIKPTTIDKVQCWRDLNHFHKVMKVEFTNGGKYANIAKVSFQLTAYLELVLMLSSIADYVFCLQCYDCNWTATESHNGFALLKLLQSYLELHITCLCHFTQSLQSKLER